MKNGKSRTETVYFSTFRGNERWIGEDRFVVGIG